MHGVLTSAIRFIITLSRESFHKSQQLNKSALIMMEKPLLKQTRSIASSVLSGFMGHAFIFSMDITI
jgi:hypothetical protein